MKKHIEDMKKYTDCWPWYWLTYGEKCYAFAVVEAYPEKEKDLIPTPGSRLELVDDGGGFVYAGQNGTRMVIESEISAIEQQNGDTICQFIAAAHAHHMADSIL